MKLGRILRESLEGAVPRLVVAQVERAISSNEERT